jgi:hypothetical protein
MDGVTVHWPWLHKKSIHNTEQQRVCRDGAGSVHGTGVHVVADIEIEIGHSALETSLRRERTLKYQLTLYGYES